MPIKAPKSQGGPRQPVVEVGTYPARTVQIIDLGLQPQAFKGESKPPKREISVTYEFPTEFCIDEEGQPMEDKPRWLSEDFVLYSRGADKSKASQRMVALDPTDAFDDDWSLVPDTPCLVTVVHNVNKNKKDDSGNFMVYANIGNVTAPMKGQEVPALINEPKVFDLSDPDLEMFKSFPEWLQNKIKGNLEFNGSPLQHLLSGGEASSSDEPQDQQAESRGDTEDDPAPY
jgi:hypothetical protein